MQVDLLLRARIVLGSVVFHRGRLRVVEDTHVLESLGRLEINFTGVSSVHRKAIDLRGELDGATCYNFTVIEGLSLIGQRRCGVQALATRRKIDIALVRQNKRGCKPTLASLARSRVGELKGAR